MRVRDPQAADRASLQLPCCCITPLQHATLTGVRLQGSTRARKLS